jgi:hypothetical protein
VSEHAPAGISPKTLADDRLERELRSLHETRVDTLLHGSPEALAHSTTRIAELEREYVARRPGRDIDPDRLRAGARARAGQEE